RRIIPSASVNGTAASASFFQNPAWYSGLDVAMIMRIGAETSPRCPRSSSTDANSKVTVNGSLYTFAKPASRSTCSSLVGSERAKGFGPLGSEGGWPSSRLSTENGNEIIGTRCGEPQTAAASQPPGTRLFLKRASAPTGSWKNMSPQRQTTASKESSGRAAVPAF